MDVARVAVGSLASSSPVSTKPSPLAEAGFSSFVEADKVAGPIRKVEVGEAVERIRSQVQSLQRDLNFSVDDSTGELVVRVVDGDSGKVVRQIPSEDILRLAERLDEMRSLLFEAKA
ncbi:flagellar protein FlaG [Pseudomonas oligotrophica]|uniref:flagellar protein FlaG n=1 Tax=Pseudomonas oligotrophica TaxID=2912055 RepID=UPI001F16E222|nr:flagellar protein FlaG [Pseudomonas oligotrophica]MCF7203438.1 flagellar protein FlaG [Pseudomonas oligotrophica]